MSTWVCVFVLAPQPDSTRTARPKPSSVVRFQIGFARSVDVVVAVWVLAPLVQYVYA